AIELITYPLRHSGWKPESRARKANSQQARKTCQGLQPSRLSAFDGRGFCVAGAFLGWLPGFAEHLEPGGAVGSEQELITQVFQLL
ncbi:MAG: hypothetical protein VBE63_28640, partial [Lamprobacter sp.]|uniref:hypothetical protein n=1 Tax=Lamprobacter sp. TaxID=3100796 RepID=UPI002B25A1AB